MRTFIIAALLAASPLQIRAQTVDRIIPLADGLPTSSDNPFGIAVDPDSVHAYVPLCGNLDPNFPSTPMTAPQHNNQHILKIDLFSGTTVARGSTGLYPEDAVVTRDPRGRPRHVYVTDATSGTVTCLTPELAPVATIPLTSCFGASFASIFPFGILASPDSGRLYVTTVGGCGTVDMIDSDPLSPTFNTVVGSFTLSGVSGRPAWVSYPLMVAPVSDFTNNRTGIGVVDVTAPGNPQIHYGHQAPSGVFPTTSDLAVLPNGRVALAVGYAQDPLVLEMDPNSGAVTRTLNLSQQLGTTGLHGVALSEDGELLVVTSLTGQGGVTFVDVSGTSWSVAAVLNQGSGALPNEAVFTPDQSRVVVTSQGAAQVVVYRDLPNHQLQLNVPPVTGLGTQLQVSLDDVEHRQPAAVYLSLAGPGPQVIAGHTIHLSSPFQLLAQLLGDPQGDAGVALPVPGSSALANLTLYMQAVTVDRSGGLRLSNPAQTVLQ